MKQFLFIYFFLSGFAINAQRPRAVQVFNASDEVSMFLRPSEIGTDKEGNIWFGADKKLVCFNGYQYISYDIPEQKKKNIYSAQSPLIFIYQDSAGNYWTFIDNTGLFTFDPAQKKFTPVVLPAALTYQLDKASDFTAKFIGEDSRHRIWICSSSFGFISIEPDKKINYYPVNDEKKISWYVSSSWVNKMTEQPDGTIYFGTNDGVIEFKDGITNIYKDYNSPSAQGCRCIINGMAQGKGNTIITTTWGNGVKLFDIVSKQFTTVSFEKPNTTCSNNVSNDLAALTDSTYFIIKRDSTGQSGFCIYNANTKKFVPVKNIEPFSPVREYDHIIRHGDFLWVGNINLLYRFYIPALINETKSMATATIPATAVRQLEIFVNKLQVNDVATEIGSSLDLKNWQNNLRIQFACKDATLHDSILFSYRLKGYEGSWHTGYGTMIQYNNVSPGRYTLMIKVEKSPFAGETKAFELPVHIHAQWWQTWWFKALVVLIIGVLTFYIYRLKIIRVREQERLKSEYEKRIAEVEMKALRAQMNPHFIFNCLNSINKYIVKSDHVTASNYLTKFSKLIRHILDNSASGIIPLQTEIDTLELYLQMEAMRFQGRFNYTITTDKRLNVENILIPSMLVQPYAENAIWHGLLHREQGECMLKIDFIMKANNLLQVMIEDNGIGRIKAAELKSKEAVVNRSRGMTITKERLELIKNLYGITATAEINDLYENDIAAGTRVVITLPLLTLNDTIHNA